MITIPNRLLELQEVQLLFGSIPNCILYKELSQPSLNRKGYIATHVLSFVQQGTQKITSYEGKHLTIQANQIGFLPRGIYTVSDLLPKDNSFKVLLFYFDDVIVQEHLKNYPYHQPPQSPDFYKKPIFEALNLIGQQLLQMAQLPNTASIQLTKMKLLEVLYFMSQQYDDFNTQLQAALIGKKRSLKTFMENNFDKPLKVEDYAYLTGRSLSSFRRDFKAQFEMTPQQWLKTKKLEKAMLLFQQTDRSVTDVCFEVGYESTSYFIKSFKAKYNVTPKQFKGAKKGRLI